ncbi:MAG: nucleotidyltransferase family protein [Cyanobacteriota bacterium]|nr:nucleotidyltransferase family protein [Cyanobacteriota bacterium]
MKTRNYQGNSLPNSSQKLLLTAALSRDPKQVGSAWTTWRQYESIDNLDAGSLKLIPLLSYNLESCSIRDDLTQKLRGIRRKASFSNQLLFYFAQQVIDVMEHQGIPILFLKGFSLVADGFYSSPCFRPMQDIDILIPSNSITLAINILLNAGWHIKYPEIMNRINETPKDMIQYRFGSIAFHNQYGYEIDLHWFLFPGYDPWQRAKTAYFQGREIQTLNKIDLLLHVISHGLAWNDVPPLRWIADACMIFAHSESINWHELIQIATCSHTLLSLQVGLKFLHNLLPEYLAQQPEYDLVVHSISKIKISWQQTALLWGMMHPSKPIRVLSLNIKNYQVAYHYYCANYPCQADFAKPDWIEFLRVIWNLPYRSQVIAYLFSSAWRQFSIK